jgi:hypothetical protein
MALNFYGFHGHADPSIATGADGTDKAANRVPFVFGQVPGFFPIDLQTSEALTGAFLETFRNDTNLTEHDRDLLVDGMELIDSQLNAVKDVGGRYFAYGIHPDPRGGLAESYLTAYVRDVKIDNPSSILAGFAKAAAAEPGVKAVSHQDFPGTPCVIAEYARTLPAVSTRTAPSTNKQVTLHQLRAAFSFPQGKRLAILELTSRHTHMWAAYRDMFVALAETVRFERPAVGAEPAQDQISRLLG